MTCPEGDPGWTAPLLNEHAPALVTYTSSTTGRPRGVLSDEVTRRENGSAEAEHRRLAAVSA